MSFLLKLVLKQSPSFRWNNHPCGITSAAFDPRRKFQTSCSPRANCKFNSLVTKEIPVKKFANVIAQSVYQPKSSSEQLQFIVSALKGITPHIWSDLHQFYCTIGVEYSLTCSSLECASWVTSFFYLFNLVVLSFSNFQQSSFHLFPWIEE